MSLLEGLRPPIASTGAGQALPRRDSEQYSDLAKAAIMSSAQSSPRSEPDGYNTEQNVPHYPTLIVHPSSTLGKAVTTHNTMLKPQLRQANGVGGALSDTPLPSMPASPFIYPKISASGSSTPKIRATTLDIPGLTKSKVSPDGRIAERDVASKLVIVMVGLPARGKSYLVKKIARYLNWLQHPTRIFNVGDRRRVAAGRGKPITQLDRSADSALRESVRRMSVTTDPPEGIIDHNELLPPPAIIGLGVNGEPTAAIISPVTSLHTHNLTETPIEENAIPLNAPQLLDQDAKFFDPNNLRAKQIREQVAHETLDELLKYVLEDGGSVGILDATNHTRDRRQSLIRHIRERDQNINVLFLESRCHDQNLLEANMRLKLSGPDYKGKDPVAALKDFQSRVAQYEKSYQPLDEFEEEQGMSYCSLIDVGRKMISHKIQGFLSVQTVSYFMNFNLAPRQIWLTRHGESMDNVNGKIGGDSSLSPLGVKYAKALAKFIGEQRAVWEKLQIQKHANTHFPPHPGDTTPPNPELSAHADLERNFCIWTSMLKRSIETSQFFSEEEYDIKQMRMLDELNAGTMEGMTYEEIKHKYHHEYELRKMDKLHYRYPGPGGEGYLDIISRVRKVILEIERMTDHVLIIGHRSIVRILLAYFLGLKQEDISDLDVPLGVTWVLEPRPYGVDFNAYRWNPETDEFRHDVDYRLRRVRTADA